MPAVVAHPEIPVPSAHAQPGRGGRLSGKHQRSEGEATAGVEGPGDFQDTLKSILKPKSGKAQADSRPAPAAKASPKPTGPSTRKGADKGRKPTCADEREGEAAVDEGASPSREVEIPEDEQDHADEEGTSPEMPADSQPPCETAVLAVPAPVQVPQPTPAPVSGEGASEGDHQGTENGPKVVGGPETVKKEKREHAAVAQAPGNDAEEAGEEQPPATASQERSHGLPEPRALPRKESGKSPLANRLKASERSEAYETSKQEAAASPSSVMLPAVAQDAFAKAMADATSKLAPAQEARSKESSAPAETAAVVTTPAPKPQAETRAEAASAAQETLVTDPQETFEQVVLGLRSKMDAKNGKAEIELNPPHLGKVNVSVTLENGALTAQFHSSSEVVRGLLKEHMEQLKTVLETKGVTVDRLAVNAPPEAEQGRSQGQAFGDASRDGRSGNQYQRDARSGNKRPEADLFARLIRGQGAAKAPIDLVG